ncbi:DUF4012 domain-containing protein [Patescibacteria group bacterium]|nr:DUF4012 domain-containing protein [Patescibacteria group bacterium]MBU1029452.1 DUF4012 domain-containing protein [Patescibacteria group bacterium]MBU1916406.1 DUF4012 domain-containing protein [Patescibacteria group bacterium]
MDNIAHKLIVAETATRETPPTKLSDDFGWAQKMLIDKKREGSPHLIDLKTTTEKSTDEQLQSTKPEKKRRLPNKWRMILDERIYLRDMRHRSVSVRPRGWRDLPAKDATTLWHAVSLAVQGFFAEHPLAELTVLSLLQTMVVLVWKLLTAPIGTLNQSLETKEPIPSQQKIVLPLTTVVPLVNKDARTSISLRTLNPATRRRGALGYAAIALTLFLSFGAYASFSSLTQTKEAVMARGLNAIDYLKSAGAAAQAKDFSGAEAAFSLAGQEFQRVKDGLGALTGILTTAGTIAPSTKVSGAGLMLVAGESLAEGGRHMSAGLAALETSAPPADRLRGLNANVLRAIPYLKRASQAIAMTSPDTLPEEYRNTLDLAKAELPNLLISIEEVANISGFLALIMGSEEPRRYLLVFQNTAEIRPTGGFIGSFALLDVNRGQITNLEIPGGGSYDLQGSLTAKIAAPKPLRLINPRWEFQDANWSPDFPTSAQRLAWFYEKSGGPTVDGVIAINSTVMEDLLKIVGSIEMNEYDVILTAENFVVETQREVELDYDREANRPKQILADLAPKILERVMSTDCDGYIQLAKALETSLTNKNIQLWFTNSEIQNQAMDFGWSGELKSATGDYLQIVHTNIAGQKTDAVMNENVSHEVKVLADGSAIVTLKIKRSHHGVAGEQFSGVRNVDYLRVYVPLGSSLVEAEGFEIPDPKLFQFPEADYEPDPTIAWREEHELIDRRSGTRTSVENGKTVFANWVQTDPGETNEVKIIYQLPLEITKLQEPNGGRLASMYARLTNSSSGQQITYSLLVQKQSGTNPIEFTSTIDMPRGYHIIQELPNYETDDRDREVTSLIIDNDYLFGLTAESPLLVD